MAGNLGVHDSVAFALEAAHADSERSIYALEGVRSIYALEGLEVVVFGLLEPPKDDGEVTPEVQVLLSFDRLKRLAAEATTPAALGRLIENEVKESARTLPESGSFGLNL